MKKMIILILSLLFINSNANARITCSEISSFKEACFYLNNGIYYLDRDNDGIPCEQYFHKPCTTIHSKLKKYKKNHYSYKKKHHHFYKKHYSYIKITNNKHFKNVCTEVLTNSILEYHNLKAEQDLDTGVIYKYPKVVYVVPGIKNYNYYKKHCEKERFSDNHKKLLAKMIKLVE